MPATYNYDALDTSLADEAKIAALKIRRCIAHERKIAAEIGRNLLAMKDAMPHGEFGKWIDCEFGMTIRTAQLYMTVARDPDAKWISLLGIAMAALVAAPSTPSSARDKIVAILEGGEIPSSSEVKALIARAKAEDMPEIVEDPVDAALNELEVSDEVSDEEPVEKSSKAPAAKVVLDELDIPEEKPVEASAKAPAAEMVVEDLDIPDEEPVEASAEGPEAETKIETPTATMTASSKAPAAKSKRSEVDGEKAANRAAEIILKAVEDPGDLKNLAGLLEHATIRILVERLSQGAKRRSHGIPASIDHDTFASAPVHH